LAAIGLTDTAFGAAFLPPAFLAGARFTAAILLAVFFAAFLLGFRAGFFAALPTFLGAVLRVAFAVLALTAFFRIAVFLVFETFAFEDLLRDFAFSGFFSVVVLLYVGIDAIYASRRFAASASLLPARTNGSRAFLA
jgi:hypothetical protein